ncbi:MAG: hypothetical protein E7052_03005 [Lentisphaerae bacterium]|nr:hypothetical protein [Lentisphaerota bacterium]
MKVLSKIVRILELFAGGETLSFAEIVQQSSLTRSNTAHLLSALCEKHLLEKTSFGHYCLGSKIFELAGGNCQQNLLNILAQHSADRIAKELNELGVIVAYWQQQRITLAKVHPERMVQLTIADRWFERSGWYRLSSGRLLLALQSDDEIARIIEKIGLPTAAEWPEAITPEKLYKQIEIIRRNRHTVVMRENGNLTSLAVPAQDASGADTLCISTVYLTGRHQLSEQEIIAKLQEIAADLQEKILFHHISMQDINSISSITEDSL